MPWVADFRDLFDQFDSRPGFLRRLWTRWRSLLERRVVKSSSAITTISEGLARLLQARHRRAVHVISNGFDPEDIAERNGAPIPRFNLVFTGIVYREASPRLALDAMASLLRAGEMREEDISVDFYGWTRPVEEDLLRGYGYPQIVRFHSHVVAEQCAAICRSAAVLLLGGFAGLKGILGGKVFEYLAAQRPILCAPSDHDCMAALLGETNAGASCSTVQEAAARLLEWYKEWKATGTVRYSGKREAILKYSRDRQAEALAQLLNTITSGGAS
jgi:glycosyltransferase involved in cell wall biosynthesis